MEQSFSALEIGRSDFNKFRRLIYEKTDISLDESKRTLLQSRLQKRLRALNIPTFGQYFSYLQNRDPVGEELQEMINRVTTNKTHFFREPHHFDFLRDVVIANAVAKAKNGEPKKLRIWSAGCSSGEEPYSIAMSIEDSIPNPHEWDIKILASDIDTKILTEAESGEYHSEVLEEIEPQIASKHFVRQSEKVSIHPEIKKLIAFRQINFAEREWPIHVSFDAIFCRNVMIYFDIETQDRLVRRFAKYLKPNGHFFIGHSESLNTAQDVYQRTGTTVFSLRDKATAEPTQTNLVPPSRTTNPTITCNAKRTTDVASPPLPNKPLAKPFGNGTRKSIIVGEVFASDKPMVISTVLGPCVAACLYDEVSQVGGMNHFALPEGQQSSRLGSSFGVNAMELLINAILKLGGARHRLKAKVFGAARINSNMQFIGSQNEEFIRNFLINEEIPVEAELLGGDTGMNISLEASTGRVRVKRLNMLPPFQARSCEPEKFTPDITLF